MSAEVKQKIEAKIAGKKVMVFSKTSCPYCRKAKDVFKKHIGVDLNASDMEIWEIEREPECSAIQDTLLEMTGGRSVPRVFINGQFIGGGDETVAFERSGELAKKLKS